MKSVVSGVLFVIFLTHLSAGRANAVPQLITDTFIGGVPDYELGLGTTVDADYINYIRSRFGASDIVGAADYFDVDWMTVDYLGTSTLSVVIHSAFMDNIGIMGIGLGDLFVSTDGYSALADTTQDVSTNGEDWEIAIELNNRDALSGTLGAYTLVDKNVELSWVDAPEAGRVRAYRSDQEVRYNSAGEAAIGGGTWSVDTVAQTLTLNVVFDDSFETIGGLIWGFHWAMTCGNDVIEGGAGTPIPEPSSALLLLCALAGAMRLRRNA